MNKHCKGCRYAVWLGGEWYCDYLGITGHRRPCPPGTDCTVRTEAVRDPKRIWKESIPMKARDWDTKKARALYDAGQLDGEIAAALGIKAGTVAFWRRSQGLPSNWTRQTAGALNGVAPPGAPEPPSPAPPPAPAQPQSLPKAAGPVALSIDLNDCSFALRAPDLAGAARAYAYAGRLLENLTKALAEAE